MYKWLLQYITQFDEDFPVSAVKGYSEYEICRMIQECCETGEKFEVPASGKDPIVDTAVAGEAVVSA